MTDADEHVEYDPKPAVALPSMVADLRPQRTKRRRSTIVRARLARRHRWWVVFGFAGAIVVLSLLTAIFEGTILFLIAGLAMAAVTITTQYLAESDIAIARARSRACEREMGAAKRELAIVNRHFAVAHNAIKRVNPVVADDLLAGVNTDLLRAHLTTRRLEADA
jgi:hypothetical protein